MSGFFDLQDDKPIVRGDEKAPPIRRASVSKKTCEDCGVYEDCLSPKLQVYGEGEKQILVIGDCPSKEEDTQGTYGTGTYTYFLKDTFKELGFSFKKDCWYTTALICRPRRGNVHSSNVGICASKLNKLIEKLKPKAILILGEHPFTSLIYPRLSGRLTGTAWTSFVGDTIPDQEYKTNIVQTNHPSYLLSTKTWEDGQESAPLIERDPSIYESFKKDILSAYALASKPFYESNYKSDCLTTLDENEAIDWILDALDWKYVAFDYETTGLKPHREGHRIVCISISNGMYGYAFPFFDTDKFKKAWKKLMVSKVRKIAHNIQFEMMWTKVILGYWPETIYWDTMLSAHCIHNQKPTGLKYHVYKEFGDIGYDDDADPFLKASKEEEEKYGANAINRIDQAPLDKLLLYNALDSLYTYKLYELHLNRLDEFQMEGFMFFMDSSITLVEMQDAGIKIDLDKFNQVRNDLWQKLKEADDAIMASDEVKLWDRKDFFNHKSSSQLAHLLFDIMKIKPLGYTESGLPSVDKETLPKYGLPLVDKILKYREYDKLLNTFIDQYKVETVNGRLHCYTNINRVDSFRSSMNSVNLQQIPKRNKEAKKYLRSFVVADPGYRIMEADHSQLEVRINACYSGDKNLIKFITDKLDMHTMSTQECFLLEPGEVKPEYRNAVKGMFVFAEFYGSYYAQVAKDLWEFAQENELKTHLYDKGIQRYAQFEEQIKEAERILWEERFPEHNQWRKDMWKFYQKHGYIEAHTGFRLLSPMRRNNSFNGQVQGSAFHLLLDGLNMMRDTLKEKKAQSKMLFEVHDAVISSVYEPEADLYDTWMFDNCVTKVMDKHKWVIVPLVMEKERSAIGGAWSDMEKCGVLKGAF